MDRSQKLNDLKFTKHLQLAKKSRSKMRLAIKTYHISSASGSIANMTSKRSEWTPQPSMSRCWWS